MSATPREAGLRMPAEWAEHERTLICWPAREAAWRGTTIDAARDAHAEVAAAIAAFEPVTMIADPLDAEDARRRCTAENLDVVAIPIDDSWIRDSGPLFVTGPGGARAAADFGFNAWGEAFTPYDRDAQVGERILARLGVERYPCPLILEGGSIAVDGEGVLVTTEQCNLAGTRGADRTRERVEDALGSHLGAERVVWLGRGLVEDLDTDGHVDNVCAFVEPGRVLLQTVADSGDPNAEACAESAARLRDAGLQVEELELLPRIRRGDEEVVVPYLNFYLANDSVIVPVAEADPGMDEDAVARIGALYPGREAIGVPARVLALGGGGIHCITQQVPVARA